MLWINFPPLVWRVGRGARDLIRLKYLKRNRLLAICGIVPILVFGALDYFSSEMESKPNKMLWEEPTLLNQLNFKWVLHNDSLCRQSPDSQRLLVPVLIHTAINHFREREAMRKTWLSIKDGYKNWDVRPVFLLGLQNTSNGSLALAKGIKEEFQSFGDLVVGNFLDTYHNLAYKHLMGYKWILNFCSNASSIIKCDDDMFIDIFKWLDGISEDSSRRHIPNPDIYCLALEGTKPKRNNTSKHFVSWDTWPEEYYPYYCCGRAYGITMDAIRRIYSVSKMADFLWIDDALVTGVLVREVERRFQWKPIFKNIRPQAGIWYGSCAENDTGFDQNSTLKMILGLDRENLTQVMNCLWKKIVNETILRSENDHKRLVKSVDNLSFNQNLFQITANQNHK